ncbi:hypothetical protein IJH72_01945 [Candidatus Saccharibacteria bacterium]|nr:hypothetical protein [Candidatus Saccharibacteria bacterium]
MEDNLEKRITPNYLLITFIFIQIIIIITAIVSLSRIPKDSIRTDEYVSEMSVSVTNISEIFPDVPENNIKNLKNDLYELMKKNNTDVDLSVDDAQIRTGSEHTYYFEKNGVNYYGAIIDVPSLSQSYQFFYEYLDSEKDGTLAGGKEQGAMLCLENEEDVIYPEFDCKNNLYDSSSLKFIVNRYLALMEFNLFSARVDSKNNSRIVVYPTSSEATQSNSRTYIKQVKDFIQSLGISPDIFTYDYIASDNFTYNQDLD